jgi:glucosamine-6-phosphate deaminase
MNRKKEIRNLLKLSPDEVINKAGNRLRVCKDIDDLHKTFAQDLVAEIQSNNAMNKKTVLILPVGPTGQYPVFSQMVKEQNLSLKNCTFFFMDEYCSESGTAVSEDHPLSFKGEVRKLLWNNLSSQAELNGNQMIFPDENNIEQLSEMINESGGINTCYGGIGIHGHLAFNEPEEGVIHLGPRKVGLNKYTITINAVRAKVGGNLECFPRSAYTLGMKEILSSQRIMLYCRNGCELDWANTVLRLALFGTPGDDYPVTHIRDCDYTITTDFETLQSPMNHI